jgi:Threonine aldolase
VVAELEAEIAGLLGKPAAVYLPSGTMAQQSVLRVHADRASAGRWCTTRCATWTGTRTGPSSGCTA